MNKRRPLTFVVGLLLQMSPVLPISENSAIINDGQPPSLLGRTAAAPRPQSREGGREILAMRDYIIPRITDVAGGLVCIAPVPWEDGGECRMGVNRAAEWTTSEGCMILSRLHAVAQVAGLVREQFHREANNPHYEVKGGYAIRRACGAGATFVSWDNYLNMCFFDNNDGRLCPGGSHRLVRRWYGDESKAPPGKQLAYCEACSYELRKA